MSHCWMQTALVGSLAAVGAVSAAEIATYNFSDVLPDNGADHFRLPFFVPAGTGEVQVSHQYFDDANILDWGLDDCFGFRGWGGGNAEDIVISEQAASRSYLAGPLPVDCEWAVVVGKAQVQALPGGYEVLVTLRDEPTIEPQPERSPYTPAPPLNPEARWYAGDFHVHSRESGDAQPSLDDVGSAARAAGLDFVMLSEHNTNSQLDFFGDVQPRFPDVLFLPGVEYTTYYGHANGIGATKFVDHKIGLDGCNIQTAAEEFQAQGAVLSINHYSVYRGGPFSVPNPCIGCTWDHLGLDMRYIGAMEVGVQAWNVTGSLFTPLALSKWDSLCRQGYDLAPIGGSDDHKGGNGGFPDSPIGSPTTMVFAENLSAGAIVDGVRRGRTVVKLYGNSDPMLELVVNVEARDPTVRVTVTGVEAGAGNNPWNGDAEVRLLRDGTIVDRATVTSNPFELTVADTARPTSNRYLWRAELYTEGMPRTITSHTPVVALGAWQQQQQERRAARSDQADYL